MLTFLTSLFGRLVQIMLHLLTSKKHIIQNLLSIYVKAIGGSTLCIDVDPKCKVSYIKRLVAPQLGLEPNEMKVIFAGKELGDDIVIEECDLGQQSILHVVKIKRCTDEKNNLPPRGEKRFTSSAPNLENGGLLPLCEILDDSMFSTGSESTRNSISVDASDVDQSNEPETSEDHTQRPKKVHFFVYCPTCKDMKNGKLRVRCHFCKSGAFTVHADPQSWTHVLEPKQITGTCENVPEHCELLLQNKEPTFADFYFKCSEHVSLGIISRFSITLSSRHQ